MRQLDHNRYQLYKALADLNAIIWARFVTGLHLEQLQASYRESANGSELERILCTGIFNITNNFADKFSILHELKVILSGVIDAFYIEQCDTELGKDDFIHGIINRANFFSTQTIQIASYSQRMEPKTMLINGLGTGFDFLIRLLFIEQRALSEGNEFNAVKTALACAKVSGEYLATLQQGITDVSLVDITAQVGVSLGVLKQFGMESSLNCIAIFKISDEAMEYIENVHGEKFTRLLSEHIGEDKSLVMLAQLIELVRPAVKEIYKEIRDLDPFLSENLMKLSEKKFPDKLFMQNIFGWQNPDEVNNEIVPDEMDRTSGEY